MSDFAFFALLRAGLWQKEVRLLPLKPIHLDKVYQLAVEQSVVGLLTAGLEQVADTKFTKDSLMPFMTTALSLEQRNQAMNVFIAELFRKLSEAGITAVLVKGQGIAQSYERPLWRACGDVDLLLDAANYEKAKVFLAPLAQTVEDEDESLCHLAMTIGPWEVELHGTLRSDLGRRMDAVVDAVQKDTFENKKVRLWRNGDVEIPLPSPDNDVILVFSHILQHFFKGGIGLRQICDWCRLLWTYRQDIDLGLLESRLREMGVMSEWKAFASLAVDYLRMPVEAMPLYDSSSSWQKKAKRVLAFVLETGNFGHNRDMSYKARKPYVVRKAISLWMHTFDGFKHFFIFPLDTMRGWGRMIVRGFGTVAKGK